MTQDIQNFADDEELARPKGVKESLKLKSEEPQEIAEKEKSLKSRNNLKATNMPKQTKTKSTAKRSTKKKNSDVVGDDDRSEAFMAAIAYLPPLFIIPLLSQKDSKFAQFHAKQAMAMFMVLMLFVIIWWVFISNLSIKGGGPLWWLNFAVKLTFVILFGMGFFTAFQGKMTPIPPFSLIAKEIKV